MPGFDPDAFRAEQRRGDTSARRADTPADPAAILAGIRELISDRDALGVRMNWDDPAAVSEFNALQDKLAARVPALLKAVQAALKLADDWDRQARADSPVAASRLRLRASELRLRIRPALTGQEASDAGT